MSSSFYLPGLEDSLRSTMGESCPTLAFVPVLDLPDSQILNLSCWLSLWKSRQSLETLIPSLHNSAGTHLGFSRTWKSKAPARHDATAGHLHGRWTRKTLKLQNVSRLFGQLQVFSKFHVISKNASLNAPWRRRSCCRRFISEDFYIPDDRQTNVQRGDTSFEQPPGDKMHPLAIPPPLVEFLLAPANTPHKEPVPPLTPSVQL